MLYFISYRQIPQNLTKLALNGIIVTKLLNLYIGKGDLHNMKKIISILVCTLLICTYSQCLASDQITVILDCAEVEFSQAPVIQNDRTLVPVRAIFEALGATVDWNAETKTVTSSLDNNTVVMVIDNKMITVNGTFKTLDVAPQLISGNTMVPTRAVAESFNCSVEWDAANRSVIIYSQEFLKKIDTKESFSSVNKLTSDDKTAVSAFNISYFKGYDLKTNSPDGTAFEVSTSKDNAYASLSVRADIYTGNNVSLTDEYVKSVADGIVTVTSGSLLSYGVVILSGIEFMKIEYTVNGTMHGVEDTEPDITIYMGRKNGIVYTLTSSIYGDVGRTIIGDFNYMTESLLIA